jgi:hypothetical protein
MAFGFKQCPAIPFHYPFCKGGWEWDSGAVDKCFNLVDQHGMYVMKYKFESED